MLMPWVLVAESNALFAHVLHERGTEVAGLAEQLGAKLPRLLAADSPQLDIPVLGGVMLAEGCWLLGGDPTPEVADAAVRMVALGHRFGYHRALPTLAWANVRRVVEDLAPGRLAPVVDRYADIASVDLLDEAREAVSYIALR